MSQRRLVIPGQFEYIQQACDLVTRAAESAGMSEQEAFHCQLAVDEACTNIIEHAYGGEGRGEIEITCDARDGELTIVLFDRGLAFDPTAVPEPNWHTSVEEANVGGIGLYFIRKVMDIVDFHCTDGGNTLVMVKRRGGRRQ